MALGAISGQVYEIKLPTKQRRRSSISSVKKIPNLQVSATLESYTTISTKT